jgi:hypothetical protein
LQEKPTGGGAGRLFIYRRAPLNETFITP